MPHRPADGGAHTIAAELRKTSAGTSVAVLRIEVLVYWGVGGPSHPDRRLIACWPVRNNGAGSHGSGPGVTLARCPS